MFRKPNSSKRPTLISRELPRRFRMPTNQCVLDDSEMVRRWTYGTNNRDNENKILLLVGETGVGKTTLINTMFNYLLGTTFESDKWCEVTEEDEDQDQSQSQTSEITVYELFPPEGPVSLTIIDTPGYGDTRGLEKDMEVAQNLSTLFHRDNGVSEINGVCFVIKASQNRLSDRQYYIISSVLSLFGKDIVNNIVFLITHSDGLPPKNVLNAIEKAKVPCRRDPCGNPVYFLFNNRHAEQRYKQEPYISTQRAAWNQSMDSVKKLLQSLPQIERRSLYLTSKVLKQRMRLEASIINLQMRFREKELKIAEKTQIQQALKDNKDKIEKCKNFEIEMKTTVKEKVKIENTSWRHSKATTCTVCEENCHEYDCWWVSNPSKCEVMKKGHCTVCTGRCHHSKHVKENKKFAVTTKTVRVQYDSIKKDYEKAQEKTETFLDMMKIVDKELMQNEQEKGILLEEAYQTINNLSLIALKPDSAFTLQHLDFFIPKVREAGKRDWAEKLEELKRNAADEKANKSALSYLKSSLAKLGLQDLFK